jgi:hypothetical protein
VVIAPKASGGCRPPGPTTNVAVLVAASKVPVPATAPFGPVTVKLLLVNAVGAEPELNLTVNVLICGTQVAPAAGVTDWILAGCGVGDGIGVGDGVGVGEGAGVPAIFCGVGEVGVVLSPPPHPVMTNEISKPIGTRAAVKRIRDPGCLSVLDFLDGGGMLRVCP